MIFIYLQVLTSPRCVVAFSRWTIEGRFFNRGATYCTKDRKFGDEGPNFVETKKGAVYELLCEVLQLVKNKTSHTSNINDNVVCVGLGKNPILRSVPRFFQEVIHIFLLAENCCCFWFQKRSLVDRHFLLNPHQPFGTKKKIRMWNDVRSWTARCNF